MDMKKGNEWKEYTIKISKIVWIWIDGIMI